MEKIKSTIISISLLNIGNEKEIMSSIASNHVASPQYLISGALSFVAKIVMENREQFFPKIPQGDITIEDVYNMVHRVTVSLLTNEILNKEQNEKTTESTQS